MADYVLECYERDKVFKVYIVYWLISVVKIVKRMLKANFLSTKKTS